MNEFFVSVIVVVSVLCLIFLGAPIFLALGFSGFIGILLLKGTAWFYQPLAAMYAQLDKFVLVAVPLFILMGEVLFITGVGKDLYDIFSRWLYFVPGGLR